MSLRAAALVGLVASACSPQPNEVLVGTYSGGGCQATSSANTFLKAQVIFSTNNYDSQVSYFSDSACTAATFSYEQQGAYRLGQPAAMIPGATEVDYDAALRLLTPQTDAIAQFFNTISPCGGQSAGGWVNGVRRDVTMYGCRNLVASCQTEYDVLLLDGGTLYVGNRQGAVGDTCSPMGRPVVLGPGLQKQEM